ncbi:universal stress protein [Mangrovimonas spongiae]|uniref:Universal stress protein n=1 Tax=Mangrovimonas spongiae TaxID=2494697 RepID=A0A428K2C0_9FLAO|nr:universal stress protein [Mangrovimonas spongiae]RSK40424.1 universal stress protein [Mangrovimonas spongiae]
MKNILFLTDFSENSWNALTFGLDFFVNNECNFYLLHVTTVNTSNQGETNTKPHNETIESFYIKPVKKQLRNVLKRIAKERPQNTKHKFYTLADYGFFVASVRQHVSEKNIDLILMGTQGVSNLRDYIVGSHTGSIITKVQCTTLVVPEKATYLNIKELAFPTDFALSSDIRILQPIAEILKTKNANLRLLHIGQNEAQLNIGQKACKDLLEDYFDTVNRSYHFLNTSNNIEDEIQSFIETKQIDMMVMVAKNLNYFQQILFHNNTTKISYHTKLPFYVIHE